MTRLRKRRRFSQAYNRGGRDNINVLKAYTKLLFDGKRFEEGESLLADYRSVWAKLMDEADQMSGPLTVTEQNQRAVPYGHGIGIAYYLNVLNRPQPAETTLRRVVAMHPDRFDADYELFLHYKEPKTER